MTGSNHNGACAAAVGHVCRCSECTGALHGWQGWVDLAIGEPAAREARRKLLESKAASASAPKQLRPVYLDLARLDIADYLARREQRSAAGPASSASLIEGPSEPRDQEADSSELGHVKLLAQRVMADTWNEIKPELDRVIPAGTAAGDVRRQMASHVWCDLLIALVRIVQQVHDVVDLLSEKSRNFVTQVLLKSSKKGLRKHVIEAVVDLVVDKVWSALRGLAATKLPLLGPGMLRALRMLAVFTCPSPESHREVHQYAVVPLMNDAVGVISDEIKTHIIALVPKVWALRSIS